jgi:SWI/SNF-related matrix-associated actin-dependent regulator 1 of chromatin subfamily A
MLKKRLKPFQVHGSLFLQSNPHALLADEPGLGKTVQAIDAAVRLDLRSILVVCPASVRMGWHQEVHECGAAGLWNVISYEQAVRGGCDFDRGYDGLVLDEAHYLKTPDSKRTQAIFGKGGLARSPRLRARWALTGTPVLNRPRELWPLLKNLHGGFAEMSWAVYAQRYCGSYFNGREMDTRGASNVDELRIRLGGFMLRRTKDEVLPELPARLVSRVPLKLAAAAQQIIDRAEREILDREAKISAASENYSQLGDMAALLHATGLAKIAATMGFINDLLETEEKVVVFFKHTDVGEALRAACSISGLGSVAYQGGMNDAGKHHAIEAFKSAGVRVFLGQIQAAGTGINGLQEVCSSVVFAELDWTPGVMVQAMDRLHRIGQKAGSVNAYLLHAPGTMESAVLQVQNSKGSVVGKLMGEAGWRA